MECFIRGKIVCISESQLDYRTLGEGGFLSEWSCGYIGVVDFFLFPFMTYL